MLSILSRYSLLVTGDAYVNTDSQGRPVTYETRVITRVAYNGSLFNSSYNGLLPYSSYQIQVNASNRAGYIMSNSIALSTLPDGKFFLIISMLVE